MNKNKEFYNMLNKAIQSTRDTSNIVGLRYKVLFDTLVSKINN